MGNSSSITVCKSSEELAIALKQSKPFKIDSSLSKLTVPAAGLSLSNSSSNSFLPTHSLLSSLSLVSLLVSIDSMISLGTPYESCAVKRLRLIEQAVSFNSHLTSLSFQNGNIILSEQVEPVAVLLSKLPALERLDISGF